MHTLNQEQIEDFALNKGFQYSPTHTIESIIFIHSYDSYDLNKIYRSLSAGYYKDDNILSTQFSTQSQKEYIGLKNQIKQKGYHFTLSQSSESGLTSFIYVKDNVSKYHIRLDRSYGKKTGKISYSISVINQLVEDQAMLEINQKNL